MMNIRLIIFSLFVAVVVSACGGDSSSSTDTATDPVATGDNTTINSYTLTGTSVTSNGVTPINAGVNNGVFRVEWNVTSSDPYHVDLFLSDDNTLSETTDTQISSHNCGALDILYECDAVTSLDGSFDNQNKISVGTVNTFNPGADLTNFLSTIPKSAFMIIKACNSLLSNCKTSAIAIELQ